MRDIIQKTLALNTATGTHCAIESAVVAIYLNKTRRDG